MGAQKILVTGAAGFIGYHLCKKLCDEGWIVIGLDNINNYYDPKLKKTRLELLSPYKNFKFYKINLIEKEAIKNLFKTENFDYVVNLAAQAGVRYSIENPYAYIESNIVGFTNLINEAKNAGVKDFIYASSSSTY